MNEKPVFYDVRGRRQRRAVGFGAIFAAISATVLTVVAIACLALPFIPGLPGGKAPVILRSSHPPLFNSEGDWTRQVGMILSQENHKIKQADRGALLHHHPVPKAASEGPIAAAFYEPWQDTSLNSLRDNAKHITHLMPSWLEVTPDGGGIDLSNYDPINYPQNQDVAKIADDNGILVYPMITNDVNGIADEKRVAKLLDSKPLQTLLISRLVGWLVQNKYEGLNVDFEELTDADYKKLPAFLNSLTDALHAAKLGSSFDVEYWRIPESVDVTNSVDFIVLMDYDWHSDTGDSGAIAPLNWYISNIQNAVALLPADKVVVGVGNYGYDWDTTSKKPADSISYQDAAMLAQESRDDLPLSQRITFDPIYLNSHFDYDDDNGDSHTVWLLDAASAYDEVKVARETGLRGEALWELGTEDPSIWTFYGPSEAPLPPAAASLSQVSFPYEINFKPGPQDYGEILQVPDGFGTSKPGFRTIQTDAKGYVVNVTYRTYPTPIVIDRIGKDPKKPPFVVALTFDDGPDGTYTPEILQTLEDLKVPGTFFVIGENAVSHPGLLRREYRDGDEIGSHTFTHPNMAEVSDLRARLEMDATKRAIQSITGHSTLLFRPPYNADVEPTSGDEVKPVEIASDLGYYTVGESVDPQDWCLVNPGKNGGIRYRTTEEIAHLVLFGVKEHQGSIVLLHDGGGDRHMTVAALKILVPQLKALGYKFVTVSDLLGMSRDQVMPPLSGKDLLFYVPDIIFFYSWYIVGTFLTLAFLSAIALGLGRILFITPMAIVAEKRSKKVALPMPVGDLPLVSVVIAAFNEEEVIVQTIESVLASQYSSIEVIVVNDGSRDRTLDVLNESFERESRVLILSQENCGKAAALSHGMKQANGDVYVYLDADTILDPDAIGLLVAHFANPEVGAVAGNVKVGNRINTLTRLQAVEYIASQNLDRRAYALVNTVTVVPGAIGAWRKTAVEQAGGYTSDTLAEDMDLTWRVRLAGWKIDNESKAIAYTEAPATLKSFFKQRFRWTFGTLQCLFKHRKALGKNGLFGRVALPALWIYQFGIQVIAPFVDLQLFYSVTVFSAAWASHSLLTKDWRPLADASQTMAFIGFMYALFFLVEFGSAWIAFRMDGEKKGLLWWLFFQRFIYRQVLYLVVWKALWTALKGGRTGWGKFERKGTVAKKQGRKNETRALEPASKS